MMELLKVISIIVDSDCILFLEKHYKVLLYFQTWSFGER